MEVKRVVRGVYERGKRYRKDAAKYEKQKEQSHHLVRQSRSRLGDGRDFASGVAQKSQPRGRFGFVPSFCFALLSASFLFYFPGY